MSWAILSLGRGTCAAVPSHETAASAALRQPLQCGRHSPTLEPHDALLLAQVMERYAAFADSQQGRWGTRPDGSVLPGVRTMTAPLLQLFFGEKVGLLIGFFVWTHHSSPGFWLGDTDVPDAKAAVLHIELLLPRLFGGFQAAVDVETLHHGSCCQHVGVAGLTNSYVWRRVVRGGRTRWTAR